MVCVHSSAYTIVLVIMLFFLVIIVLAYEIVLKLTSEIH